MLALLALVGAGAASAAPVTYGSDALRTGWYPDQSSLTPQLVTGGTFGQLFSTPVDGQVYAQPLVWNGVLLVVTEANKVYGLDPVSGAVKWQRSDLGTPFDPTAAPISCSDLTPTVGITGTPVIDDATGTAYFYAKRYVSGGSGPTAYDLHALDMASGAERAGFPVRMSGTADNNARATFNATYELQRPGLLLMDGVVYAGFGGHCDAPPYQGWVIGVSTSGQVKSRWVARAGENPGGAGIWQAGGGLTSDGPGRIIVSTGNGVPSPGSPPFGTPGTSPPDDLGMSVIRLQVQADGKLRAADFFAPYDAAQLDEWDADLGSGAPVALPPSQFGTTGHPSLVVEAGKGGYVYLLDANDLGGIGMGPAGSDDVVSRVGPYGGVWSRPAVWPGDGGWVYMPTGWADDKHMVDAGVMRAYRYGLDGSGTPGISLGGSSDEPFPPRSGAPVVTSNGTTSGSAIVWAIATGGGTGGTADGAQLRAYAPVPWAGRLPLLWSAPIGAATKFASPGVAGGRLYVGARDGHVLGFGAPVNPPLDASSVSFEPTVKGQTRDAIATFTATRRVTVDAFSSTNPQFALGAPSRALPVTLTTGQTISVPVTFAPTTTGQIGGTLSVATAERQVDVGLSGTGLSDKPQLVLGAPLVSFGGTRVGGRVDGSVTISNSGGGPLTVGHVSAPSAPFRISNAPADGAQVPAGGSVTFGVTFEPSTAGAFTDAVQIATDGGDGEVGLSGTAADPPQLELDPASLDFGEVHTGETGSASFTIRNAGDSTLTINKSKPPAGGVFVARSSLEEGTRIGAHESRTLAVEFTPRVVGAAGDVWTITGDDGSGVRQVTFTGRGQEPPAPPSQQTETPALLPAIPRDAFQPIASPPRIAELRLTPARLPRRARPRIRFHLTKAAPVTLSAERRAGCSAPIGRCYHYVRAAGPWTRMGRAGINSLRLRLRLAPGRYRLTAKAAGGTGNSAAFRVTRR